MVGAMNDPLDETITITSLEEFAFRPTRRHPVKERLQILFIGKTVYTGISHWFREFEIGEATTGYLLSIDLSRLGESITVSYKDLFAGTCLHLDDDSAEEVNWLVARIVKKVSSKENYKMEIVQKYLELLLLQLKSEINEELTQVSMTRSGVLIKNFFTLLEDRFMTAKTVDYYAGKLCVSPKHLTNVIKLESGHPTSYHINQRIVVEAKRIVRASGASLKEIAYELGYEDVSAFSKLFKRVTGENFSSYKCKQRISFPT